MLRLFSVSEATSVSEGMRELLAVNNVTAMNIVAICNIYRMNLLIKTSMRFWSDCFSFLHVNYLYIFTTNRKALRIRNALRFCSKGVPFFIKNRICFKLRIFIYLILYTSFYIPHFINLIVNIVRYSLCNAFSYFKEKRCINIIIIMMMIISSFVYNSLTTINNILP